MRKLISWCASGYSFGQSSSLQTFCGPGLRQGKGTNLSHALGDVPPTVPTLPVSTFRKYSALATIHPPRLPAAAERQLWLENALPALAISRATSTIVAAGTPLSSWANSGVYSA